MTNGRYLTPDGIEYGATATVQCDKGSVKLWSFTLFSLCSNLYTRAQNMVAYVTLYNPSLFVDL